MYTLVLKLSYEGPQRTVSSGTEADVRGLLGSPKHAHTTNNSPVVRNLCWEFPTKWSLNKAVERIRSVSSLKKGSKHRVVEVHDDADPYVVPNEG